MPPQRHTFSYNYENQYASPVYGLLLQSVSSFADYFVIATGTSDRQLGALADDVEDKFAEFGIEPKSKDGRPDTGWILVDGGDVIVNIFTNETRDKYTLEKIWSDCESILVD